MSILGFKFIIYVLKIISWFKTSLALKQVNPFSHLDVYSRICVLKFILLTKLVFWISQNTKGLIA